MATATEAPAAAGEETLQCHFTWNLDSETTKQYSLDELAKKLVTRLPSVDGKEKAIYLNTLAFLHTRREVSGRVELSKAKLRLDECLELAQRQFGDSAEGRAFQFLARANWLLSPLQDRQQRHQERQELLQMWEQPEVRAHVLAAKGATLRYFGPGRYHEGSCAYREALRLLPEAGERRHRFDWLWGRAYLLARMARVGKRNSPIPEEQQRLWADALAIADDTEMQVKDPRFYMNYAEAILHNKELRHLCQTLTGRSHQLLADLPAQERQQRHTDYQILLKLFRKLRPQEDIDKLLAESRETGCEDEPNFHLQLANDSLRRGAKEEAISQLEEGQRLARKQGHVWIDLKLVELRASQDRQEEALLEFDSLAANNQFESFTYSRAAVMIGKSMFLLSCRRVREAADGAVAAAQVNENAIRNLNAHEQRKLLSAMHRTQGLEAHVAWFVMNFNDVCRLGVDYQQLLQEAVCEHPQDAFAREQLGRCLLKKQQFAPAAEQLWLLPESCESKNQLLAEALLQDTDASLSQLAKALSLGPRSDATERVLSKLRAAKETQASARQKLLDGGGDLALLRRDACELCAQLLVGDEGEMESQVLQLLSRGDCQQLRLLRRLRLKATQLHQEASDEEQEQVQCINVLKEAKEACDRAFASRLPATADCHWSGCKHAFSKFRQQLKKREDYNRAIAAAGDSGKWNAEVTQLMKMLRNEPPDLDSVRECLEQEIKEAMQKGTSRKQRGKAAAKCAPITDEEIEFLAEREHRILTAENAWLVRWFHFVNMNKHAGKAISWTELNLWLQDDSQQTRTAYDLCQLAAEFAEETCALLALTKTETETETDGAGDAVKG